MYCDVFASARMLLCIKTEKRKAVALQNNLFIQSEVWFVVDIMPALEHETNQEREQDKND